MSHLRGGCNNMNRHGLKSEHSHVSNIKFRHTITQEGFSPFQSNSFTALLYVVDIIIRMGEICWPLKPYISRKHDFYRFEIWCQIYMVSDWMQEIIAPEDNITENIASFLTLIFHGLFLRFCRIVVFMHKHEELSNVICIKYSILSL
jgi:hypothetical protein